MARYNESLHRWLTPMRGESRRKDLPTPVSLGRADRHCSPSMPACPEAVGQAPTYAVLMLPGVQAPSLGEAGAGSTPRTRRTAVPDFDCTFRENFVTFGNGATDLAAALRNARVSSSRRQRIQLSRRRVLAARLQHRQRPRTRAGLRRRARAADDSSADEVPARMPAFCRVHGVIAPEVQFRPHCRSREQAALHAW